MKLSLFLVALVPSEPGATCDRPCDEIGLDLLIAWERRLMAEKPQRLHFNWG